MQELEHELGDESADDRDDELTPGPGADPDSGTGGASVGTSSRAAVELSTGEGDTRLLLPPDAGDAEVAAIVSAIAARLREESAEESNEPEASDRWRLAGRLGARRRYELPRECRRGGEWKAASRCP